MQSQSITGLTRRPPHARAVAMAESMTAIAGRTGCCTRDQLLDEGFTPDELDRFADQARALAGRRLKSGVQIHGCRRFKGRQIRRIEEKLAREANGVRPDGAR
jgi:hypothetical protein